jgi:hypothetical protein
VFFRNRIYSYVEWFERQKKTEDKEEILTVYREEEEIGRVLGWRIIRSSD